MTGDHSAKQYTNTQAAGHRFIDDHQPSAPYSPPGEDLGRKGLLKWDTRRNFAKYDTITEPQAAAAFAPHHSPRLLEVL